MSSPAEYSPLLYKQRYEELPVPLESGQTVPVSIHNYVNKGIKAYFNPAPEAAFLNTLDKTGIDMELRVDTGDGPRPIDKSLDANVRAYARYAFAGKGAPEHCQIVLQLADHWNLASNGLQAYADAALGLDCNGFVGNYLWHVASKHPHPWTNLGVKNSDYEGPDSGISAYFIGKRRISSWGEMRPGRCYILGRADASGDVIDKVSGSDAAHIAITESSLFRYAARQRPLDVSYALDDAPLAWGFRPSHLRAWSSRGPLDLGDPSIDGVYVVESTAAAKPPGLSASWYSLAAMKKHGVFELNRESMAVHRRLSFRIAELG
jgi:hypothetical protein